MNSLTKCYDDAIMFCAYVRHYLGLYWPNPGWRVRHVPVHGFRCVRKTVSGTIHTSISTDSAMLKWDVCGAPTCNESRETCRVTEDTPEHPSEG